MDGHRTLVCHSVQPGLSENSNVLLPRRLRVPLFSEQFKAILRSSGTKIVRTSIQAPNMNAFAERFVLSIKSECLDRMIFVGGDSLDRAIRDFMIHYHGERPHQGLENALISGGPTMSEGRVEVRGRLGGLLKYYYREAA